MTFAADKTSDSVCLTLYIRAGGCSNLVVLPKMRFQEALFKIIS